MSAPTPAPPSVNRIGLSRLEIAPGTWRLLGALAILLVASVGVAGYSTPIFVAGGVGLLVLLSLIAWRSPRLVLVGIALMPIFDRYIISIVIPRSLDVITNFFSEGLLLLVGIVLLVRAVRDGRLLPALRHPAVVLLAAFLLVCLIGMVVNGVPPVVAVAGILFTVDAVALFFLPRFVGFQATEAAIAAGAFVAVAGVAALLAIAQVTLAPTIFGMQVSAGRFNEGHRVSAFFDGNPNMLGAVLAMGAPFPAVALRYLSGNWRIAGWALLVLLCVALLYTFSRGAWLGLAVSMIIVAAIVDWRPLAVVLVAGALAFGAAKVLPHNLLGGSNGSQLNADFNFGDATLGRVGGIGSGTDLRVLFIRNALPIVADHPIVGVGPGRWGGAVAARFPSPLYDQYVAGRVPRNRTVDNFWLHLLVETGIVGTALLVGLLAWTVGVLLWAARRAEPLVRVLLASFAAVGIVIGVDSVTEMLLEGNTTSFAMWFLLGVGSALLMAQRRAGTSPAVTETAA